MLIAMWWGFSLGERMLEWVVAGDRFVFHAINSVFTHSALDSMLPVWREAQTWYPLYLFLFVFSLLNFGKSALWWMLFFGLTIAVCDQVSSAFLKDFVGRERPCREADLVLSLRLLLNRCPGHGSFPSSHAANHFAMAVFIVKTFHLFIGKWRYVVYGWAASICYAQVYIGVHYPTDVIGGALLGSVIGYAAAGFFNRRIGEVHLPDPQQQNF